MKITDTNRYSGVKDHQVDLFEGQFQTEYLTIPM